MAATFSVGERTFTVRPRTLAVDRELAPFRADLRRLGEREREISVKIAQLGGKLDEIATAEKMDDKALAEVNAEITEIESEREETRSEEAEVLVRMIAVMLTHDGEESIADFLIENLDLNSLDEASEEVGLRPPTDIE